MFEKIAAFFSSAGFAVVAIFGINLGTEEPPYQVLEVIGQHMEIRSYPARLAAETTVPVAGEKSPDSRAFGIIAAYIFGENQSRSAIAMTAPVETQSSRAKGQTIAMTAPVDVAAGSGSMTMRFFMPSSYTKETLPVPNNPRVKIVQVEPQIFAVRRYSGLSDEKDLAQEAEALQTALKATSWQIITAPRAYYYNPPWTLPMLRRNEAVIEVRR